ncbi:unnamed protein product [marine sediment metagenome]|uniref:Uncharacterized protein n=1 Tax=marine sediment metagenome TaxID=412755 RepID=X1FR34_9ZZZZ
MNVDFPGFDEELKSGQKHELLLVMVQTHIAAEGLRMAKPADQ